MKRPMVSFLTWLMIAIRSRYSRRVRLEAENLILRQQLHPRRDRSAAYSETASRVTVLDNGVVYRGRRFKSLSEVARAITGTHWSGPLFFGLKNRAKEVVRG
jgi:hypothetical protein